jgi:hypothetical protein
LVEVMASVEVVATAVEVVATAVEVVAAVVDRVAVRAEEHGPVGGGESAALLALARLLP